MSNTEGRAESPQLLRRVRSSSASYLPHSREELPIPDVRPECLLLRASEAAWPEITDPPSSSNQAKVGKERQSREMKVKYKKQTLIRKRTKASLKRAKFKLSTYQGVIFTLLCLSH